MDYALLCAGSLFTVGVVDEDCDTASMTEMVAAPERTHKMAATTTGHVITAIHESSQVTVDRHESSQVTVDRHESSPVTVDRHESRHVTAHRPESRHVTAHRPESRHITAHRPESRHITASSSSRVLSRLVCSSRVLSLPVCYTWIFKVSPSTSQSGIQREGCTTGVCQTHCILKPTHSSPHVPELIPLSEVLPMVGIAFWCV